jgi:hypothetical protein
MNELVERIPGVGAVAEVLPGGGWTLTAVSLLALPGVRRALRPAAKMVIRGGLAVTDSVRGVATDVRQGTSGLVSEVRSERTPA